MAFFAFFGGIIVAGGLGFFLLMFLLMLTFNWLNDGTWLMSMGLIQWIYLIPLFLLFMKRGYKAFSAGLLVGGGLVFLLVSACWGLFMIH